MKKYIGNIVVENSNIRVDKCYNKCLSIDEIDKNIPTLIIGLNNAKEIIDNFSILVKSYNDGMLWWTFTKMERRSDYDIDINNFYNLCIKYILYHISFKNINVNDINYNNLRILLKYINNNNKKYYYIDENKYIFICDTDCDNKMIGISLNTCAFYGVRKKKIINLIGRNSSNIKINNFYSIPSSLKKIIGDEIPVQMVLFDYFS